MIRLICPHPGRVIATCAIALGVGLGCSPEDPVTEARTYLDQGRARAAIELLEPVVREQRENLDAQYYYGVALTMIGEGGLAEWSLRRAMEDPKWRRDAGLMIVSNALRGQNPQEAVKILSEMIEDDPENIDLLLARATAYAETRINIDDAMADVELVRDLDPSNLESYRPEILAYLNAVMSEEAAASLDALGVRLEQETENEGIATWYCTTMALFAMESQEAELARERFEECVERYPADVATLNAAVDFFQKEGEVARAIEILERGIDSYDGRADSGFAPRLAELYLREGRLEDAEAVLLAAGDSENVRTAVAYKFQLSGFYEQMGRIDDALEQFEQAVALMDEVGGASGVTRFNLADLLIRAGRLDRALEVASALEHTPFRLMVEARVAQEKEAHMQAIQLYSEAGRLWPDNEYARYHAARSSEQIGDFDGAIELYRHATRISVDSTNAMSRIATLLHAAGGINDAFNLLRTQQQRAALDEVGELLKVELMVLSAGIAPIPGYLAKLPATDAIGTAPRLASVFRGLRRRGEPGQAIDFAARLDPRVFVEPGGAAALIELSRCTEGQPDAIARVDSILDSALAIDPVSASLLSVRGYLAEESGQSAAVVAAAFDAALERDPDEPSALLGRARGLVATDPVASRALTLRALEAEGVESSAATQLALLLMAEGRESEALEICARVIKRTPYDGKAAAILAAAALESGDHSDRTLDLARRAVRFARSRRSNELLRDTYAARGDQARADELSERIRRRDQSAGDEAQPAPQGPDGV